MKKNKSFWTSVKTFDVMAIERLSANPKTGFSTGTAKLHRIWPERALKELALQRNTFIGKNGFVP